LSAPDEDVLELDHPGIDEEERRIVRRHERRRRHDRVPTLGEVLEEPAADLGGFHDGGNSRCGAASPVQGCAVAKPLILRGFAGSGQT
jgi:hypothetical protein